MPTKILCAGDLHIGRRPSRLPDAAEERRHSVAAVWSALVDLAIRERVDAVALTGDIVDQTNKYLEAYGPLEAGVRRLVSAGIDVFAVAGNHDFDVLPRLARSVGAERFHFLGAGGRWERFPLARGGRIELHVDAWSFPEESVRTSPLATYDLPPAASVPTLGILHADLDQAGSRYAPVGLAELRGRPVVGWVLGHVHEPRLLECAGAPLVLYPGSLQPLDPGETGPHGAWLLEIGAGPPLASFRPIATVRYERLPLDLGGAASTEDLEDLLTSALRDRVEAAAAEEGPLEWLAARVRLEGKTRLFREAGAHLEAFAGGLRASAGGLTAFVEKVESAARPEVSLEDLSRGRDAAALLARSLIALERGKGPPAPPGELEVLGDLLREAERRLATVARAASYLPLTARRRETEGGGAYGRATPPEATPAREILLRQGLRLLDALLEQKEAGP